MKNLIPQQNSKGFHMWLERMVYVFMIALVTVALLFVVGLYYNDRFNVVPMEITSLDLGKEHAFCPGERFDIHNHIVINEPMLLYIYITVLDSTESYNILDTQIGMTPRQHPQAAEFDQMLPWTVPELPPGTYYRGITYRGYIDSQKPVQVDVPFRVKRKEECRG
jgi:hypothetical protein